MSNEVEGDRHREESNESACLHAGVAPLDAARRVAANTRSSESCAQPVQPVPPREREGHVASTRGPEVCQRYIRPELERRATTSRSILPSLRTRERIQRRISESETRRRKSVRTTFAKGRPNIFT